jgi:hypothetical protein
MYDSIKIRTNPVEKMPFCSSFMDFQKTQICNGLTPINTTARAGSGIPDIPKLA